MWVRLGQSGDIDPVSGLPERGHGWATHEYTPSDLAANDHIACRIDAVDLKNRFCGVETDRRNRLHLGLLRIVGALTAIPSMALMCRWRSRPQHHKQTLSCCRGV
jgi:hypothetical protein